MPRLDKNGRLQRLLAAGYFPAELPPPFVTERFSRYRNFLSSQWPAKELKSYFSAAEKYTVPRYARSRRALAIVNPVNQYKVAHCISEYWPEIKKFLNESKIAEFKPIFDRDGPRALFGVNFDLVEHRLAEILAVYPNALKTDISRYYPTIYTHAIPWALYGKAYAKANLQNSAFMARFGSLLDKHVRNCQDRQSVGLPIGPDTSRIIGEIIGVAIEKELSGTIDKLSNRALRYVDDLAVGFGTSESAEVVVSNIQAALSHMELDMNIEKTKVLGIGEVIAPEWLIPLRRALPNASQVTANDIEEYFKLSLYLAQENPKDAVPKYAIKRSRSFKLAKRAWPYYQNWILRLARHHPECLPTLAQILIEKRAIGVNLDGNRIRVFLIELLERYIPMRHHFEVAWLLFTAKGLAISLAASLVELSVEMDSSVCSLICFDLDKRRLLDRPLDKRKWASKYDVSGLKDDRWLFVYEATKKVGCRQRPVSYQLIYFLAHC